MATKRVADSDDIVVTALVKGAERYFFFYNDTQEHRTEVLRQLGRFASNPGLSFTWYDAAILSKKVRSLGGCTMRKSVLPRRRTEVVGRPPAALFWVAFWVAAAVLVWRGM